MGSGHPQEECLTKCSLAEPFQSSRDCRNLGKRFFVLTVTLSHGVSFIPIVKLGGEGGTGGGDY